jgi:hypothetical protein
MLKDQKRKPKALLVCWSRRPIHGALLQALADALDRMSYDCIYLGRSESAPLDSKKLQASYICSSLYSFLALISRRRLQDFDLVYLQSTHPLNLIVSLWARFHRLNIAYYLHEPTDLTEKLKKGDPVIYACLVRVVQYLECWFTDVIFIAAPSLLDKAHRMRRAGEAQILALPLAIPDLDSAISSHPKERTRLLYLGRAHPMRCLDQFFKLAEHLESSGSGVRPTLLTYSPLDTSPPCVDTRAGRSYSDLEMLDLLEESFAVWNVYDVEYSQSGVTPVALRSGVPLLVSSFEKERSLVEEGVAIEVSIEPFDLENLADRLTRLAEGFGGLSPKCLDYFKRHYAPQSLIPILHRAFAFNTFSV